jgi:hypothetical protein
VTVLTRVMLALVGFDRLQRRFREKLTRGKATAAAC